MSGVLKELYAPSPNTERGKATHVGGDPKNKRDIVYCVGQTVVVRNLDNPMKVYLYRDHQAQVTVARYSPSGFYIASSDVSGKLRVWDTVNEEHVCTLQKETIGIFYDLGWSEDSKRLIGGGSGRQAFGEAFFADSGSSVGQISGHSKAILTCDFKPTRPYRAATGSEDFAVNFYEGPPFKFSKSLREHTKYVNCVRFSPDGNKLVSVSSDKRGIFYDGKTGEMIGELSHENGHTASIYSCAWSEDSRRLLTVSADKTAKIWNAETYQCLQTFNFLGDIQHMQVGCIWQGNQIVTISLRGDITLLDEHNPERPIRVINGHSKKINSLVYDGNTHKIYTVDIDSNIIEWNVDGGHTAHFEGSPHGNSATKLALNNGNLYSISLDDTLKVSSVTAREFGPNIAVEGQPIDVKGCGNHVLVLTNSKLITYNGGEVVSTHNLNFDATSLAVHPSGNEVAVGGKDKIVHVLNKNGNNFTQKYNLNAGQGAITCLEYSSNGQYLASGESSRHVKCWEGNQLKTGHWVFHSTTITSLSWCPDNEHVVSGSVDTNLIVWSVNKPMKRIVINGAHYGGVTGCCWIDANTVASVGDDCCLKTWTITKHA